MKTLKGFAFVGFSSKEGQQAALSFKGFSIRNKLMSISPCVAPGKAKSLTRDQESRALYLTGIVNSLTEKDLVQAFGRFGAVEIARIIIDHSTMLTKGYGFLVMSDKNGHEKALEAGNVWIGKIKIKAKKVTLSKIKGAQKPAKKVRNDNSTENTSSSKKSNEKKGQKISNQEKSKQTFSSDPDNKIGSPSTLSPESQPGKHHVTQQQIANLYYPAMDPYYNRQVGFFSTRTSETQKPRSVVCYSS